MDSDLIQRRIEAWRAAGLIDDATARRLAEAEVADADDGAFAGPDAMPPPAAAGPWPGSAATPGPSIDSPRSRAAVPSAVEVFGYLGTGFVLGAWFAFAASVAPQDATGWYGLAALVAAAALGAVGIVLRGSGPRWHRAAGVALLAALPNVGVGVYLLLDAAGGPSTGGALLDALIASLVTLAVALGARRLLPALTTQAGLALATISTAAFGLAWLEERFFGAGAPSAYEMTAVDAATYVVRAILQVAWWLLVAGLLVVVLVTLDRGPGIEARRRLGRLAAGMTAVVGTAVGALSAYPWWADGVGGEPVLPAWLGAAVVVVVAAALVAVALRRAAVDYLWPPGLGVLIALTYLNAEYVAVETGLWVALLAEAVALFGVAIGLRRLAARINAPAGAVLPSPA